MNVYKSFFLFLGVLLLVGIAFGVYVHSLDSCSSQTAVLPAIECHRLYLAFGVLFAVALMLALGSAFYALIPAPPTGEHPGKEIFDTLAKSLLPVVTLVLGYYFGSAPASGKPEADKALANEPAASSPLSGASVPQKK